MSTGSSESNKANGIFKWLTPLTDKVTPAGAVIVICFSLFIFVSNPIRDSIASVIKDFGITIFQSLSKSAHGTDVPPSIAPAPKLPDTTLTVIVKLARQSILENELERRFKITIDGENLSGLGSQEIEESTSVHNLKILDPKRPIWIAIEARSTSGNERSAGRKFHFFLGDANKVESEIFLFPLPQLRTAYRERLADLTAELNLENCFALSETPNTGPNAVRQCWERDIKSPFGYRKNLMFRIKGDEAISMQHELAYKFGVSSSRPELTELDQLASIQLGLGYYCDAAATRVNLAARQISTPQIQQAPLTSLAIYEIEYTRVCNDTLEDAETQIKACANEAIKLRGMANDALLTKKEHRRSFAALLNAWLGAFACTTKTQEKRRIVNDLISREMEGELRALWKQAARYSSDIKNPPLNPSIPDYVKMLTTLENAFHKR